MSWRSLLWLMSFCRGEATLQTALLHDIILLYSFLTVLCIWLCYSVSRPDKVLFPPPNWKMSQGLREEQDVGPELQHVFEVP